MKQEAPTVRLESPSLGCGEEANGKQPPWSSVVDLIDHVLADSGVGPDAARWVPGCEPASTADPFDLSFEPGPNRYAWVAGAVAMYRHLSADRGNRDV